MATGKKFYWIKIKESFMTSDKVDFLMSQKNGANYVVLYQMLCLKTINTGGELARELGEIIIPFDENKIQRDCKYFEIDTIRIALELYKKLGMIYVNENNVLQITDFGNMVGGETDYANQKRFQRNNQVAEIGVDKGVDNVHTEYRDKILDIRDIDIDKDNNLPYINELEKSDIFTTIEKEFGRPLSSTEIDKISYWLKLVGEDYFTHALREALMYRKVSVAYIDRILASWQQKEYTLAQLNDGVQNERK